jgi:hypothetical protein
MEQGQPIEQGQGQGQGHAIDQGEGSKFHNFWVNE